MALSQTRMADGIQNELWSRLNPGDAAKKPVKAELRNIAEAIAKGVIDEILANLEIKTVSMQIDTPAQTVEIFTAGVGSNGGSLVAAGTPGAPIISGLVKHGLAERMVATQDNDGTGLVA